MNKYSAEKIAQEYYQAGLELVLVKEAGLPKEIVKKMVQAPVAGLSGYGALLGMNKYLLPRYLPYLPDEGLLELITLGTLGGGAMLGAAGAGKAVDLAHSGGSKLLNKLRR